MTNDDMQTIHIENFEGPLDLLLQLIESQKMEITKISLMEVCEPFVAHVRAQQGKIPPEELADFLVVAAKLVYLKSKALLPGLTDAELEEGTDLETQLRMYKQFALAADRLGKIAVEGLRSYGRMRRASSIEVTFIPPEDVDGSILRDLYEQLIRRLEPMIRLPKAAVERVVTIEEKIGELSARIGRFLKTSFHVFLSGARDRHEMVVSFLALLELIRQRTVKVEQRNLFHDIVVRNA